MGKNIIDPDRLDKYVFIVISLSTALFCAGGLTGIWLLYIPFLFGLGCMVTIGVTDVVRARRKRR